MVVAHQLSVKGYIRDTHTFHWQGLNVTGHLQTDTPPPYDKTFVAALQGVA